MRMQLVGLGSVSEGVSKKTDKPYKMRDAHFMGRSLGVEGSTVAKVTLNLLEDSDRLPEILLGATYIIDISDRGYLRDLELLAKPAAKQSTQPVRT